MIVQYLIEVDAYHTSAESTETLYFSNKELNTKSGEMPADTPYMPRLTDQIFSLTRSIVSGDRIGGSRAPGSGTITLANADGALDYFRKYSFDSRQVRIYRGLYGDARAAFELVWQGVAEQIEYDDIKINIRIKDRLYLFEKNIQDNLYPASLVNQLGGKPKPILFGQPLYFEPELIDATNKVYQVHDGSITNFGFFVQDRLVTLSTPSDYSVNYLNGTFQLTADPAGLVTCIAVNIVGDNSLPVETITHILTEYAGFSSGDIDSSFTQENILGQFGISLYIDKPETITSVLDKIINSIGGYYYFTRLDKFTARIIAEPGAPADHHFTEKDIILASCKRLQTALPVYSVRVAHSQVVRPMARSELASGVSLINAQSVAEEWKYAAAVDSDVKDSFPNARAIELPIYNMFSYSSAGNSEANRLLDLYKKQRDVIQVSVKIPAFSVDLGETVYLEFERYGFSAGAYFTVISITDYGYTDTVELTLWGTLDRAMFLTEDGNKLAFEDGSGFLNLEG